ncbi:MAG: hypothetical protein RMK50_07295, partial [Nitrososphaerota archaeon]|nr:hypothetical protein [Candidatus Bathyarchaeota archaeon]MDW8194603.1 hypothetical protein [Nitrososphaerota archaeon]
MQRRYMLAAAAAMAAAALIMFLATQPINQILGAAAQMRTAARDETPYGEYLEINLDTSAKTSQLA